LLPLTGGIDIDFLYGVVIIIFAIGPPLLGIARLISVIFLNDSKGIFNTLKNRGDIDRGIWLRSSIVADIL
jgi:hypothetical protein